MRLVDLLNKANLGYPDGFLSQFYDSETGELNEENIGDGLAKFVVVEISETFDPDASDQDQWEEARRVIQAAISDLEGVIQVLNIDDPKEVQDVESDASQTGGHSPD